MLRRINPSLPGLVAGILIYGFIIQFTGMWFVQDKIGYSIGLWYGIGIAIGMAVNLAMVIYDAVIFDGETGANKRVIAKSMLRYIVVAVLLGILGYFEFGNLYTAIIGVFGLKISAYMQPLLNKIAGRKHGSFDAPSGTCSSENNNKEVTM